MIAALIVFGCQGAGDDRVSDEEVSLKAALNSVITTNLQLQVAKSACATNQAQNTFKVTNATGAPIKLSQISIKYWINNTGTPNVVPSVWYGGCVTSANGTCVHPMTGVTATAVRFAPACGPDATHQANWEITISTTDQTSLGVGQTWSNLQTAVNLANYSNFTPGTSTWFSTCGVQKPFAADPHFAVYLNGDLVNVGGVEVPSCRAPTPPDGGAGT
jgi:cellulose binding protein with CBM3 domain